MEGADPIKESREQNLMAGSSEPRGSHGNVFTNDVGGLLHSPGEMVTDADYNSTKECDDGILFSRRPQPLLHDAQKISFVHPNLPDNVMYTSDSRALLGKQAETYRQEVRQQQIQKWVLKHSFSQDSLPGDCWPDKYPQSTAGCELESLTMGSKMDCRNVSIDKTGWVKPNSTHSFSSDPSKADIARSSRRHTHVSSISNSVDTAGVLHACEVSSLKRRKIASAKYDNIQGDQPSISLAFPEQLTVADGSSGLQDFRGNTTLRHWLNSPGHFVDRSECLHIFRQILEFVDLAHGQGVVLRNVRPSSFTLSSLHRVSFLDSGSSRSTSGLSADSTGGVSCDATTLSDEISASSEGRRLPKAQIVTHEVDDCSDEPFCSGRMKLASLQGLAEGFPISEASEKQESLTMSSSQHLSSERCQQERHIPVQSTHLLEETWYASPEETLDRSCSFASDIFSLGVLFFELFCSFNSWDEYIRLMADLRHRILPPRMLSECPKEAAFCLLLLHPDPTSRPSAREILQAEIFNEVGEALAERQMATDIEEKEEEMELLLDFLQRVQQQKQDLAKRLKKDLSCLTSDIQEVTRRRLTLKHLEEDYGTQKEPHDQELALQSPSTSVGGLAALGKREELVTNQVLEESNVELKIAKVSGGGYKQKEVRSKCMRLMSSVDKLEQVYFTMRWKVQPQSFSNTNKSSFMQESKCTSSATDVYASQDGQSNTRPFHTEEKDHLGCFFDSLCKYARYSRFEVKAILRQGDLLNTANMVCSLGFDRDQEYFATAGVCKRIKVFECDAVLNETVDIHYPVIEMFNKSMLSSICWNSYVKSHIVSSGYDGIVQLWDASIGKSLMQYKEHEKRAWSVDFSQVDPTKLASVSDDGFVKIWSINQAGSIGTIKSNANVCCIQFSKASAHLIAFGSADYKIYCYDLRNTRRSWCTLLSHRKAVSYVKFLDANTLVSASTDNTLKLWNLSRANGDGGVSDTCQLTYTGHTNEKNFVGLSVMDGYIACGSETNKVFTYHKSLPMPMAIHKFGSIDPFSGHDAEDDTGQFVSSVCWRGKSQTLLAANSRGDIKMLEMV